MSKAKRAKKAQDGDLANAVKVLSFTRSLDISDGVMHAYDPHSNKMLRIRNYFHGKRGCDSHDKEGDKKEGDPRNLASGWVAKLPPEADTLVVTFGVHILPISLSPDSCDNFEYYKLVTSMIEKLKDRDAIRRISRYYAYNIVNGSWLWRNRDEALSVRTETEFAHARKKGDAGKIVINEALDMSLHPVVTRVDKERGKADPSDKCKDIDALAEAIEKTLKGTEPPLMVKTTAHVLRGHGAVVYPSQLFVPGGSTSASDEPSDKAGFFTFGDFSTSERDEREGNAPGMTAEKIGNRLRTFDRDHSEPTMVIPIEPNGGCLKVAKEFRRAADKNRIFDILPKAVTNFDNMTDGEMTYLAACLVRGGLFPKNKDDKAKNDKAEAEASSSVGE